MSEDRCICCGDIVPEGRMVCPNCEKQKPMRNLSHGEMVQIAEGKKNKIPRYIDANKLIDLATHEGAYGYVDVHDIYNIPTADVVEVVRCHDCEYWDPGSPMATVIPTPCRCRLRREDYGMTAEDFCSYGRRKADAEIH